jgi:Flp pilus assembly pilin Flp
VPAAVLKFLVGMTDGEAVRWILQQLARVDLRLRDMVLRLAEPRGQTMAEYAILIGVVALVVVAAAVLLGGSIASIFRTTASKV